MSPSPECPCDPHGPLLLYVTAAERAVEEALRQVLQHSGLPVVEAYPEVLCVNCSQEQLRWLCQALSARERGLVLFHLSVDGSPPTTSQLMQSRSLQQLSDCLDAQWIDRLVAGRRLVTYFQPIINNHRPGTIYAHECLLRGVGEDGGVIPPLRLITAARDSGLLPVLDQAAQLLAIESAAKFSLPGCVFINFNPRLLDSTSEWIERTIHATLNSGIDPARFVFEVVESDHILDLSKLLAILDWFRDAGCRVALDDVGAGYNSLNLLTLVKPDFVKLDMELVRGVHRDRYKGCVARKLIELSRELGVLTVAEGVETHEEWQWTRDHGADLVQGYLFARPAPMPPKIEVVQVSTACNRMLPPEGALESDSGEFTSERVLA